MPRRISYRRQLLQAIEAFLEGTPSAYIRAQSIIQRCYTSLNRDDGRLTLDQILWLSFVVALTDSVYYENEASLREMHEVLQGQSSQNIARTVFNHNFCIHFTVDEAEWYAYLLSMIDFISTIPYTKIHQATFSAWQEKATWAETRKLIPEAIQAEKIEGEYQQRKQLLETIAARSPSPKNIGDETLCRLALREVTSVLTGISVGRAAVYCGYPMLDRPYSGYGEATELAPGIFEYTFDMTESVNWSRRVLEALAGRRGLFLSCRLSSASASNADILLISIHA